LTGLSIGEHLIFVRDDKVEKMQDKIDSVIIASKLLGHDVTISFEETDHPHLLISIKKEKEVVLELIFFYKYYSNAMGGLNIYYKHADGYYTTCGSYFRSIKYILNKAEYIVRRS
jgi:hypothetical protein